MLEVLLFLLSHCFLEPFKVGTIRKREITHCGFICVRALWNILLHSESSSRHVFATGISVQYFSRIKSRKSLHFLKNGKHFRKFNIFSKVIFISLTGVKNFKKIKAPPKLTLFLQFEVMFFHMDFPYIEINEILGAGHIQFMIWPLWPRGTNLKQFIIK